MFLSDIKSLGLEFWHTIGDMSPYLLFGFLIAGILSVVVSKAFVQRHLGGRGLWPVIKASALGVPLPLCSCSVIPVSMSLRKQGASREATLAFLLSTPQTGVDSIFVTYSLLGPLFALVRPVVALVTGLIGGMLTQLVNTGIPDDIPEEVPSTGCCCANKPEAPKTHPILAMLKHGFVTLPTDIGKPMLMGLSVAAMLAVFVPGDFFANHLGSGLLPMVVMMIVGIPMYVCATASVPIAAALILKGISPGAALVFLMAGPATNAAGLATVWKTLGRNTASTYLVTVALCALGSGLLLDALFGTHDINVVLASGKMLPAWVKHASAVCFILLVAGNQIRARWARYRD
ncbi:MAG: SO_0444 family Cu/Zn efflux transporter [Planctomycetes bacterium]|nr:SO_0444 family Cu/Zn efflux transporter [Planctomycetota bacterium]